MLDAFKKSTIKLEIKKDGMSKMNSGIKQAWMMILSFIEPEKLLQFKTVCKTFYFIFKEDEKFWQLYSMKNCRVDRLPSEYPSWRSFFIEFHFLGWDKERFEKTNFELGSNKKIIRVNKTGGWLSAISESPLMQNIFYRFKLKKKNFFINFIFFILYFFYFYYFFIFILFYFFIFFIFLFYFYFYFRMIEINE